METNIQNPVKDAPSQTQRLPDVDCDANGRPKGITLNEWIDKLDRKLAEHYGYDVLLANKSRRRQGRLPLVLQTN